MDGVPEAACWFWLPGEGVLSWCLISLVRRIPGGGVGWSPRGAGRVEWLLPGVGVEGGERG